MLMQVKFNIYLIIIIQLPSLRSTLLSDWLIDGSAWSSSGIPVSKYSTARSGLLKLALSAFST